MAMSVPSGSSRWKVAGAALEGVLALAMRDLEIHPRNGTVESLAEDIALDLVDVPAIVVRGLIEKVLRGEVRGASFRGAGKEKAHDSIDDEEGRHVYYEAEFPATVLHTTRLKVGPKTFMFKSADLASRDIERLTAHEAVRAHLMALLGKEAKKADYSDEARYSRLAEAATEYAYQQEMTTDFTATDEDGDDLDEIPFHVAVDLTVQTAATNVTLAGDDLTITVAFGLSGELIWPGDHRYNEFSRF